MRIWSRSDPREWPVVPTVVVVLLLLAAAGLAQSPTGLPRLWTAQTVSWWMVAVPALAWLGGLTLVLARTMPRPRYRTALWRAAALELALLLAGAAVLARLGRHPGTPSLDPDVDTLPLPLIPLPPFPMVDPRVVLALFGLALAAALVLVTGTLWMSRRRLYLPRGTLVRDARYGRGRTRNARHDRVLEAIARARAALVSDEDVRRAVIAAYASLESSVTELGADRSRAQTPAEFLHAAVESGLVGRRREAEDLLDLFHRARFSHLPMDAEDRERALDRLAALQHDLSVARDERR